VDNNDFWHNIPAVNQGGVWASLRSSSDGLHRSNRIATQAGPESGRNAGGTVNVVTRSGSNEIHGRFITTIETNFTRRIRRFLPTGNKPHRFAMKTTARRSAAQL